MGGRLTIGIPDGGEVVFKEFSYTGGLDMGIHSFLNGNVGPVAAHVFAEMARDFRMISGSLNTVAESGHSLTIVTA
jgi:hypothetical protein